MRDNSYINLKWICFHLQTRPVPFTVRAVVTSSDIEFNVQDIDFGFCSVFESVRRTVTITNKSVLPQQFGFCGVPDVSANFYEGMYLFWFITVFIKILFFLVYGDVILTFKFSGSKSSPKCSCRGVILFSSLRLK